MVKLCDGSFICILEIYFVLHKEYIKDKRKAYADECYLPPGLKACISAEGLTRVTGH